MTNEQIELIRLREVLKNKIKLNNLEISKFNRTIGDLKRKNSKLESKIAEASGKLIKEINGNKVPKLYLGNTKGMI